MEHIGGDILVINGKTADASGFQPDPSAVIFYEVIRVMDGRYLFLDDHLERLKISCGNHIAAYPSNKKIISHLHLLNTSTGAPEGNVRLLVYETGGQSNVVCFYTTHFYPTAADYTHGVKVKTFNFERPDPNIKKWNNSFRTRVNKFIRDQHIYEAILLNAQGQLTEGSRSNLFFVDHKDRVITAPTSSVLPGITRKYVCQICAELGIPVEERAIDLLEVSSMKACFISGTSPKVLPVQKLNNISFDARNTLVRKILSSYIQLTKS